MSKQEYVTFVVLHYNCFEETKACVDSIMALDRKEQIRVVIVDNASVNDSLQKLQQTYRGHEQIFLLHNDENVGFSAGNNRGYEYAKAHWNIEFVIFANNDLLFEDKEFIEKVRKEYENSRFGILSPDIFHTTLKIHQSPMDEKMVLPVSGVRKTILFNRLALWMYPVFYALYGKNMNETRASVSDLSYRKNIVPMGACLICSKTLMEQKKVIFAPETHFYYEEYILSYWCLKNGVDIVFQPEIQVLHNHGMATKSLGDPRKVVRFRMKNILQAARVYYKLIK